MKNDLFQIFSLENHWLNEEEKRFDSSYYAKDAIAARVKIGNLEDNGIEIVSLGELTDDVFWPSRFKRTYVSKSNGKAFLMPSEVILFYPKAKKFITNYPDDIKIEKNWILITRSGSIGRCVISNRILEDFILTDDLIRVIPKKKSEIGYLYAFLSSWIGQALLIKDRYGATVKHIESHHVSSIPVPIIENIKKYVNEKILESNNLREKSQKILLEVEKKIQEELDLPDMDEDVIEYYGDGAGKIIKAFSLKSSELDLRLDASYHIPIAHFTINALRKSDSNTKELKDMSSSFVPPRFKRAYVKDKTIGVPLLQGTHIMQTKPLDIKYIWTGMKKIEKYIVNKNWILVTCSGTIGRVSLVRDYWSGWTATNHMLRIIVNELEIHPGYLTGFLLSIYGQIQFQRLIYGGVVDEIGEAGELFEKILISTPIDKDIENEIGEMVYQAFDLRDIANEIEQDAIKKFEHSIKELSE